MSGVEQKARYAPEKWRMLVLDAFKGRLTQGIEAIITGSFMNTELVVIPGGITSKLQVLDIRSAQTIQRPPKNRYTVNDSKGLCLMPTGRIKKSSVTFESGSQWHGTASHQK